jgi:hypothetical protein
MLGWIRLCAAALAVLACPGLAGAKPFAIVYGCEFKIPGFGGETVPALIAIDASGKAFTVEIPPGSDDPVLVRATIRKARGDDRIYAYTIDNPENPDVGVQKLDFQLRIPLQGGKSRISMTARGFYGNPSGNGICEREDNVELPL